MQLPALKPRAQSPRNQRRLQSPRSSGRLSYGAYATLSPRATGLSRSDGAGASSALMGSARDDLKLVNDQARKYSTYRNTFRGVKVRLAATRRSVAKQRRVLRRHRSFMYRRAVVL